MDYRTDLQKLLDKYDDFTINFGKFRGYTFNEIILMHNGRKYMRWMALNFEREKLKFKNPRLYEFLSEYDHYIYIPYDEEL